MSRFLCWLGFHRWGKPQTMQLSDEDYVLERECLRCEMIATALDEETEDAWRRLL